MYLLPKKTGSIWHTACHHFARMLVKNEGKTGDFPFLPVKIKRSPTITNPSVDPRTMVFQEPPTRLRSHFCMSCFLQPAQVLNFIRNQ
jgi:hypothetical protein